MTPKKIFQEKERAGTRRHVHRMANAATTGTVNKKLVNQVLRRLIRAATDPASQQDEVVAAQNEAALRGYLADARTCDMVYDKILERVLTDMTQVG